MNILPLDEAEVFRKQVLITFEERVSRRDSCSWSLPFEEDVGISAFPSSKAPAEK